MFTAPTNTLAHHQSGLFTQHRDMSQVTCKSIVVAMNVHKAQVGSSYVKPESEALWFYGLNNAVALIAAHRDQYEPLAQPELSIVKAYYDVNTRNTVRAFYYLLICCIREARHNQSKKSSQPKIAEKFGEPVAKFFCSGTGGEGDIHERFMKSTPECTLGQMTGALQWQFYNSSWSGGYGGKAWGSIADCLHRFVTGEYTAEMMMDTIWTLQHNNGSVFNKGHYYHQWTQVLHRVLDVQRSGQIPAAILTDQAIGSMSDPELVDFMTKTQKLFPNDVGEFVCWNTVEELGSVHKYAQDKKVQEQKYGKVLNPALAEKIKKQKEAELAALEAEAAKWFSIMPGTKIEKIQIEREEVAA